MNRILIASAALVALSGAALAESPVLIGNYSASVLNEFNGTTLPGDVNYESSASAQNVSGATTQPVSQFEIDNERR